MTLLCTLVFQLTRHTTSNGIPLKASFLFLGPLNLFKKCPYFSHNLLLYSEGIFWPIMQWHHLLVQFGIYCTSVDFYVVFLYYIYKFSYLRYVLHLICVCFLSCGWECQRGTWRHVVPMSKAVLLCRPFRIPRSRERSASVTRCTVSNYAWPFRRWSRSPAPPLHLRLEPWVHAHAHAAFFNNVHFL